MIFMFCALDYVGKHNIYVSGDTQSFDTSVFRPDRLVDEIQIEKFFSLFSLINLFYFYYQEIEQSTCIAISAFILLFIDRLQRHFLQKILSSNDATFERFL